MITLIPNDYDGLNNFFAELLQSHNFGGFSFGRNWAKLLDGGLFSGTPPFLFYGDINAYGNLSFEELVAPTAPVAVLVTTAVGTVDNGSHRYKVTYTTASGETLPSSNSNAVVNDATHKQNTVTIPVSTNAWVTGRKIYRNTVADAATYLYLATVAGNTVVTYTDNTADALLGAAAPTKDTTTGIIKGSESDSATAVNIAINTSVNYATPGAKLLSIQNNTVEKASIGYDGTITTPAIVYGTMKHTTGTAAPVAGTWAVGDVVYNTVPFAGSSIGWVCITAGVPGIWKEFGIISL